VSESVNSANLPSEIIGLLQLLHRASQVADAIHDAALSDIALTARQNTVLHCVALLQNPSQSQICELTGIDRSTLADIVKRMVKKGLVQRRRARGDARKYALRLTPMGEEALSRGRRALIETDARLLAAVEPRHLSYLQEILRRISEIEVTGTERKAA
jgi:DNA-binding MarR family transcriptional regulator